MRTIYSVLKKKKPMLRDNYVIIPHNKLVYMELKVIIPKWLIELKLYTLSRVSNPTLDRYYPLLF